MQLKKKPTFKYLGYKTSEKIAGLVIQECLVGNPLKVTVNSNESISRRLRGSKTVDSETSHSLTVLVGK